MRPFGERFHDPALGNSAPPLRALATPERNLEPLLAGLPVGGHVLFVHPVTLRADDWDAPWTQLVRRRSAQWGAAPAGDRRFDFVGAVPPTFSRATRISVRGVLYEKTG